MPFTPVHMGPGIAIKAVMQGSFSLMVFGWTQIVMDIQPLIVMLTQAGHLHGFTHTYLGATLIAVFAGLTGKHLSEFGLVLLRIQSMGHPKIAWWVSFLSAFIGSYSHVFLDSIMHNDVEPFFPFSQANEWVGLVSVAALHWFCLYSGLVGAAVYYFIAWYRKGRA